MVVFTCDGCGESVKKNQAEKHRFRCRRGDTFSCIDCNAAFHGDAYKQHVKCVSEDQKYGAKGAAIKENKGEVKQNAWFEQVQRAIESVSARPQLRSVLDQLHAYPNVPRKQVKFVNFVGNSLRVRDRRLAEQAWEAISAAATTQASAAAQSNGVKASQHPNKSEMSTEDPSPSTTNGHLQNGDNHDDCSQPSHSPLDNSTTSVDGSAGDAASSFKWKSTVKRLLRAAPRGRMKLKRLERHAIGQFRTHRRSSAGRSCTNGGAPGGAAGHCTNGGVPGGQTSELESCAEEDERLATVVRDKVHRLKNVSIQGKYAVYG